VPGRERLWYVVDAVFFFRMKGLRCTVHPCVIHAHDDGDALTAHGVERKKQAPIQRFSGLFFLSKSFLLKKLNVFNPTVYTVRARRPLHAPFAPEMARDLLLPFMKATAKGGGGQ
jgi:hypothetical protein